MKKIITLSILIGVSLLVQNIAFLPWWSFVIPDFLLGLALPLERWRIRSFLYGFASGFLVWSLSTLYFEISYNGEITHAIGKMISLPYYLLYVIIGFIGGVLTGLAFYSGFLLRKGKEILHLDLPKNSID